ncbi:hypothetical protein [Streptomyces sp. NPDC002851]
MISQRCWAVAAAAGLVLTLTATAPADADAAQPDRCTGRERRDALRAEQADVLAFVGEHRTLRNEADLAALGVPDLANQKAYNLLDHQFASARGIGVSVVDSLGTQTVTPGQPDLLFYAPRPGTTDAEAIDPFGPDFPYRLVGWGYTPLSYTPGDPPGVPPEGDEGLDSRCIAGDEWFVHERSIHPFDTWQNIAVPPADDEPKGSNPGQELPIRPDECDPPCPPGVQHGRLWDIHFWLDERDGIPAVSILNPHEDIPGWDPEVGVSFFFPEAR